MRMAEAHMLRAPLKTQKEKWYNFCHETAWIL